VAPLGKAAPNFSEPRVFRLISAIIAGEPSFSQNGSPLTIAHFAGERGGQHPAMHITRASESSLWQSGEFGAIAIVVTATAWSANN